MANTNKEEIVLKISRIDFKTETFCTPWEGNLYCVDVVEDTEERSAWLYRANCGVKSLMWGESVKEDRDEFLDCVFSNLPDYIEDYEEDMEMYEERFAEKLSKESPLSVGDKVIADDLLCEVLEVNEEDGVFYYDVTPVEGIARGFTRTFTLKDLRPAPKE